jgi:hypothetical protein
MVTTSLDRQKGFLTDSPVMVSKYRIFIKLLALTTYEYAYDWRRSTRNWNDLTKLVSNDL